MDLHASYSAALRTGHQRVFSISGVFLTAAAGLVVLTFYLVWRFEMGETLFREDGVIEWSTFVVLLTAAAIAMWSSRGQHSKSSRVAFALILVILAGEEISWGQRLFGIETPHVLQTINVQSELNFHNINGLHQNVRLVGIMLLGAVFVVVPLVSRKFGLAKALADRANLPLFDAKGMALLALAVLLMAVPRAMGLSTQFDELGELLIGWVLLLYACLMLETGGPGVRRHSP